MSKVLKLSTALVVASLVVAVSALAGTRGEAATAVAVTAGKPTEFKLTLTKKAVPKGTVVFKVTNRGAVAHDFKIGGKKTKSLATGKSAPLTVVFKKPGKYAFLCTLPGHAVAGMKGTLVVK